MLSKWQIIIITTQYYLKVNSGKVREVKRKKKWSTESEERGMRMRLTGYTSIKKCVSEAMNLGKP